MKSNSDIYSSQFETIKEDLKFKIKSFIENDLFRHFDIVDKELLHNEINNITENILLNLEKWMQDNISEKYKKIVMVAINEEKWSDITEAFWQELSFGTSGIRGKMTVSLKEIFSENDLRSLQDKGFNSTILRGSNSINEITITKNIYALVNYMKKNNMSKVVVGYDSRVASGLFAHLVTKIFLNNNFSVFLFNDVTPLPELSLAVTNLGADMGIEITASHNDKRYNGFKLITKSGAPPTEEVRNEITKIFENQKKQSFNILPWDFSHNETMVSNQGKIVNLGKIPSSITIDENQFMDFHEKYVNKIKNLIFQPEIIKKYASDLNIGYSAIHGTGFNIVSKLLSELGLNNVKYVSKMNSPNQFFPLFNATQMLDPGELNAANVVVNEFVNQYGTKEFENLDILCYTDPDADRLGVIVKTPKEEEPFYGKWKLLKANDVWTLFMWYILEIASRLDKTIFLDREKIFIVKNYVTTDSLAAISKKYGIECVDGKVGFSDLANIVRKKWEQDKINIGMFEESNGFGIAGNPAHPNVKSHILEKDGILALALIIEIVAFAKSKNTTILQLLDKIFLDPAIGFYATFRTQIPENGIFEGIKGEFHKRIVLKFIEKVSDEADKKSKSNSPLTIADFPISRVEKYSTGRYDKKYWKNFADDGIRFFLGTDSNHITIRSSGTEPKIRIFVQYKINDINKKNLLEKKNYGENLVKKIADEFKILLKSVL